MGVIIAFIHVTNINYIKHNYISIYINMTTNFEKILISKKINPEKYLQAVHIKAMYFNYDWKTIKFANDKTHKLQIQRPDGKIIKFGAVNYNDFIIYGFMVRNREISYDQAISKRDNFDKRMRRDDNDIYSARNLSLNLLW